MVLSSGHLSTSQIHKARRFHGVQVVRAVQVAPTPVLHSPCTLHVRCRRLDEAPIAAVPRVLVAVGEALVEELTVDTPSTHSHHIVVLVGAGTVAHHLVHGVDDVPGEAGEEEVGVGEDAEEDQVLVLACNDMVIACGGWGWDE